MSISQVSPSLFHSAAAMLTTPTALLSGFAIAGAAPGRMAQAAAQPPPPPLHDRTQSALLALQQQQRAGAMAGDLGALVNSLG